MMKPIPKHLLCQVLGRFDLPRAAAGPRRSLGAVRREPPSDSLALACACGAWVPFAAPGLDFASVMRAARDEGWREFGMPAAHGDDTYFTVSTAVSPAGAARATVNARCPRCAHDRRG